jgi:hypothetical protein
MTGIGGQWLRGKAGWVAFAQWSRDWMATPRRWRALRDFSREHERSREVFQSRATALGYAGCFVLDAAIRISDRCIGAELALKKLADAEERAIDAREFPGLSPAEIERLALLAEECGEVVRVAMKILRHGWESCSPSDPKCRPSRVLLERELGSLRAVVDLMANCGDVRRQDMATWRDFKRRMYPQQTHHQGFERQQG